MAPFIKKKEQGFRDKGREKVECGSKTHNSQLSTVNSQLIYGLLPVLEALRAASRRIDKVLIADGAKEHRVSEIIDICRSRSIQWQRVPRETFAKHLGSEANHQGVGPRPTNWRWWA